MVNFFNTINTIFFYCMFAISFNLYLNDAYNQVEFSLLVISSVIDTLFDI